MVRITLAGSNCLLHCHEIVLFQSPTHIRTAMVVFVVVVVVAAVVVAVFEEVAVVVAVVVDSVVEVR